MLLLLLLLLLLPSHRDWQSQRGLSTHHWHHDAGVCQADGLHTVDHLHQEVVRLQVPVQIAL
jgi:hypothetical protein